MKGNKTYEKNKNSLKDSSVKYTEQKFQNTQNEKQAKYLEGIPSDIELRLRTEYNLDLNRTTDSIIVILLLSSFIQASQLNKSENNKGNKNIDWKAISNTLNDPEQKLSVNNSVLFVKEKVNEFVNADKNNENKLFNLLENAKIIGSNVFEKVDGFLKALFTLGIPVVETKGIDKQIKEFYERMARIQGNGGNITLYPNVDNLDLSPKNITLQDATENLVWNELHGSFYDLSGEYLNLRSLLSSKSSSPTIDKEVETALNNILEIEKKLLLDKTYQQILDPNTTNYKNFKNRTDAINITNTFSAINALREELLEISKFADRTSDTNDYAPRNYTNSSDIKLFKSNVTIGDVYGDLYPSSKNSPLRFAYRDTEIKKLFETSFQDIADVLNTNIRSSNKVLNETKLGIPSYSGLNTTFYDYGNIKFSEEFKNITNQIKNFDLESNGNYSHPAIKEGIILTKKISDSSLNNTESVKVIDETLQGVANLFSKYEIPTKYIANEIEGKNLSTNFTHIVEQNEFLSPQVFLSRLNIEGIRGVYKGISNVDYSGTADSKESLKEVIFHENLHRFFNHLRYYDGDSEGKNYSDEVNYTEFNFDIINNATFTLANLLDGKIDIDSAIESISKPRFTTPKEYNTIGNSLMSYNDYSKLSSFNEPSIMDEAALMVSGFLYDEVKKMKEVLKDPDKLKAFNLTKWDEETEKKWKDKGFNFTNMDEEARKKWKKIKEEEHKKKVLIGVGSGVGATALLMLIGLSVYCCCHKKTKEEDKEVVASDRNNDIEGGPINIIQLPNEVAEENRNIIGPNIELANKEEENKEADINIKPNNPDSNTKNPQVRSLSPRDNDKNRI